MNDRLQAVRDLGQSIWLDYIRRALLTSGELQALIEAGVSGVTSNPSIFERAILGSADYDPALMEMNARKVIPEGIYENLVLADIATAADLLREVYDQSEGRDGFVSLEVSPELARDTAGTIREARRLFEALGRPNVMIKVPATAEGVPAIEALIAEGINVNATLIFSLSQYETVARAYLFGLERRLEDGKDLDKIASVASLFISRVDSVVDRVLEARGERELQGQIAIANARVAYARFKAIFSGDRWERLASAGARLQRLLWASTSVKDHRYPDTLYVDNLIGPHTVNTLAPATLTAFRQDGTVALTLENDLEASLVRLKNLRHLGVDLEGILEKLLDEGVEAFANSYRALLAGIEEKSAHLRQGWTAFSSSLGENRADVEAGLHSLESDRIVQRLWVHDHTLWKPEPNEITNRLGWLHSPEKMADKVTYLQEFAASARAEGYTTALLLGMGGSSLAPEVLFKTFGSRPGYLDLVVLDSTHPEAVLATARALDLAKTLIIVSTKSGGTVETLSLFKYFYNLAAKQRGRQRAGEQFIAITDAGSQLERLGHEHRFRRVFLNDPNIGGRYAALSYVGLVPAALIGLDLTQLLDRALRMTCNCESCNLPKSGDNQGATLGAILGKLALVGRDKATFIISPSIASFGDWVEQLIAESTGKQGKGILPVIGEALSDPIRYRADRLFISLSMEGEKLPEGLKSLEEAGHPVVRLEIRDRFDLGAQFYLWEMATAVAGHFLGVNPFDQPDVEAAKQLARSSMEIYKREGRLPDPAPTLIADNIHIFTDEKHMKDRPDTVEEAVLAFLEGVDPGGYVGLQAFMAPSPETDVLLQELRKAIWEHTNTTTTLGYGPRYLHSTGQLHKGDGGKGSFIQLTHEITKDIPIPDQAGTDASSYTFGTLLQAQALGDRQALMDKGRRVLRVHLVGDIRLGLQALVNIIRRQYA